MKKIALIIFGAVILTACNSVQSAISKVGGKQASIVNTQWILAETVKGKTPTLSIENGKISGNSGCNSYFGGVTLDATAGNFSATNLATTKMACSDMAIESNFLSMLGQADKYVVSENTLSLYKGQILLMKFNKQ